MQVVYSGGSTPNPSPRLQRKTGYGRPIMPGYMTHVHPQILVQRSRQKLTEGDTTLRDSIPAMSTCVAGLCLLLNIVLPGCGTLMAGLSVLCCSKVRPKGDSKSHCIWVNAGVALVQFLLTFLFLLGWIWSIMWGVTFLSVSKQYYNRKQDEDDRQKRLEIAKMKSLPKPDLGANDGNIIKKQQNHQYDSCQQEEHRLEHQQRQTNKTTSTEPQICRTDHDVPRTSSDASLDVNKQNTNSICASFSQDSSICGLEPNSVSGQPIIVLQQAPLGSQSDTSDLTSHTAPGEKIMVAKTRHMKILQRKMSNNDLSPFALTHKQLEAIVIHDMPVRAPESRQTTEPSEGLPKH